MSKTWQPGDLITAADLNALESVAPSYAAGLRTTNLSIPASSNTVVTWTATYGSGWSGPRVNISTTAKYLIVAGCKWSDSATANNDRGLRIRLNGSSYVAGDYDYIPSNACFVIWAGSLTAGDYVELVARNSTIYAQDITGASIAVLKLRS